MTRTLAAAALRNPLRLRKPSPFALRQRAKTLPLANVAFMRALVPEPPLLFDVSPLRVCAAQSQ